MKKLWVVVAVILGLNVANPERAEALSCFSESIPTVGVVKSIEDKGEYFDVRSEKVHSFSESDVRNQNNINIDQYVGIVIKYVKNGYSLNQKVDLKKYRLADRHTLVNTGPVKEQLKVGDVIINGPPSSGCDYSFTGIFSGDGRLKLNIVGGAGTYTYRGKRLSVVQGKIIKCDSTRKECITQVKVGYGSEEYAVVPGNSQSFNNNSGLKSLFLVNSSIPEPSKNPNPNTINWSPVENNSIGFVLVFDSNATAAVKPLNIFQRFWGWIRGWK